MFKMYLFKPVHVGFFNAGQAEINCLVILVQAHNFCFIQSCTFKSL